ncbi:MAG: hypothetical protein LUH07_11295, partial [Lachnospiraceae bacterium]|nr:hypothetical protein [Lachnospiraceae bacterium]
CKADFSGYNGGTWVNTAKGAVGCAARGKCRKKEDAFMLQFFMEKNVLLYLLAAACAVGVVSQMILRRIYDGLIRETRSTQETGGRLLQQLRQRFQYCEHLNERVGNVQALIQRSLMEYRVWGISLHSWKRIGVGCLMVSLLCAFAGTVQRIQGGAAVISGNTYFWMGAGAAVLTAFAYGIADTGYRDRALRISLCDYLENSGAVSANCDEEEIPDMEYEADADKTPIVSVTEGRRAKRRAKTEVAASSRGQRDRVDLTRAQKDKMELRENLARVKSGMQETAASDASRPGSSRGAELLRQMDPKEQERLIREVLNEFLSQ